MKVVVVKASAATTALRATIAAASHLSSAVGLNVQIRLSLTPCFNLVALQQLLHSCLKRPGTKKRSEIVVTGIITGIIIIGGVKGQHIMEGIGDGIKIVLL